MAFSGLWFLGGRCIGYLVPLYDSRGLTTDKAANLDQFLFKVGDFMGKKN